MRVEICPIKGLYRIADGMAEGCGAILSSASEVDEAGLAGLDYVLRQYEDLDYECPGRSFSDEAAETFASYLRSHPSLDTLYCCCDAGESRSPAVAAAVLRFLGRDDLAIWSDPHYHPNMLVFEKLMAALGMPVADEELDLLIYINQKAFRDAIGR